MKSGIYKVLISLTEYGRNIIFFKDASFFSSFGQTKLKDKTHGGFHIYFSCLFLLGNTFRKFIYDLNP